MHLLNVRTLDLEEFVGSEVPDYAILSHRWGKEELNFKDVSKKRADRNKQGYIKMASACQVALNDFKLEYLWIDTCCIDKRSSAELSEAINSIYRWYQNAVVCIVYLSDVAEVENGPNLDTTHPSQNSSSEKSIVPFAQSEWFSRAWTLQELLAPGELCFYNFEWKSLGNKRRLLEQMSYVTRVPDDALCGRKKLTQFSIADRMCWASHRQATREEDLAYSLLGIFDVNMPMLYGEGQKAFTRLQEEIIKHTSDHTFLMWETYNSGPRLLASSPAEFADSADFISQNHYQMPISLNHICLDIEMDLVFWDWEVYGIEFIRGRNSSSHFMLLRRDHHTGFLYRDGVGRSSRPHEDHRKQGVTILRDSLFDNHLPLPVEVTFCGIRIGKCFWQVQPLREPTCGCQRLVMWEIYGTAEICQCRFYSSSTRSVARMMCNVGSQNFHIDFCIDFEFVPHLYIKNSCSSTYSCSYDITAIKDSKKLMWITDISGSYQYAAVMDDSMDSKYNKGQIVRLVRNRGFEHGNVYTCFPLPEILGPFLGCIALTLTPPLGPGSHGRTPCWEISIKCV